MLSCLTSLTWFAALAFHGYGVAENLSIDRIYVGHVCLFMVQSNLDFLLDGIAYGDTWGQADHLERRRVEQEFIRGRNKNMRLCLGQRHGSKLPMLEHHEKLGWLPPDDNFQHLAARSHLFASHMQPRLAGPVGVVQMTAGGSHADEWLAAARLSDLEASLRAQHAQPRGTTITA